MGQTNLNLVLGIPQGFVVATSLGIDGFAHHRSPGSGKYFQGRAVYFDLALKDGAPAFKFLDEGDWRNAAEDTHRALEILKTKGGRTKTAVSNNALSCVPLDALEACYLVKTGGHTLEMGVGEELVRFPSHEWKEGMAPSEVSKVSGVKDTPRRHPRLYLVLSPIEFVILSNLTPEEYVWYACHRAGKIFRQVVFTELKAEPKAVVSVQSFEEAWNELDVDQAKKTKTLHAGNVLNRMPFQTWIGYDGTTSGGIYTGDRDHVKLWKFPHKVPSAWDRADG